MNPAVVRNSALVASAAIAGAISYSRSESNKGPMVTLGVGVTEGSPVFPDGVAFPIREQRLDYLGSAAVMVGGAAIGVAMIGAAIIGKSGASQSALSGLRLLAESGVGVVLGSLAGGAVGFGVSAFRDV